MLTLERKGLNLHVFPEKGSYSLRSIDNPHLYIEEAWLAYQLHQSLNVFAEFLQIKAVEALHLERPGKSHLAGFKIEYADRLHQVSFLVEIGLVEEFSMLLIRQSLINEGSKPVWPEKLFAGIIHQGKLGVGSAEMEPSFYTNGWQSWSPAAAYRLGEKQERSWMGPVSTPMICNPGTPITRRPNHFSSDMFACLGNLKSRMGLVAGYLSQKESFGSVESHVGRTCDLALWANSDGLRLDPGKSFQTDWASFSFTNLDDPLPFRLYLQSVSLENKVRDKAAAPLGWCSWYYYFQNVSEKDIRENLEEVARIRAAIPLNLIQIDDGFEKSVGEWMQFSPRFPNGLSPLADLITEKGFIPGVWLAPYIVEARSGLVKAHPDWLLKDRHGRHANSGFVWNWFGKALDLTNPEAAAYTDEVIRTAVQDWGFKYLKLDFLYAAAIAGRYQDPTFTRAQVLRRGLERIREAAGEQTQLLGCGCPLGSGIGLMDYMRISEDVSPEWEPSFMGQRAIFRHELDMPSARNAIRNIISRSELDGHWWGNDPDCLLVREDCKLSLPEIHSLATAIGMTGGAMLVSDRMPTLSDERREIIQALIPVIPSQPHVLDFFERKDPCMLKHSLQNSVGSWPILAAFNWENKPRDILIRADAWKFHTGKDWIAREFWSGEIYTWHGDLLMKQIAPHGVRLLTIHALSGKAIYLGSEFHFSQGFEVKSWLEDARSIKFSISLGRSARGKAFLWLPKSPAMLTQDGLELPWEATNFENVYAFAAKINGQSQFELLYAA
ncbi:MAG: glycoside hydrolase family 36 protein [Anaerolineaceae bacterium]|nr:glycoside hydrolase family 36 protein [Anaerolineaceae bacterium]